MKILFLFVLSLSCHKLYERVMLDEDEQKEQIILELDSMDNHGDFFESFNIYYKFCLNNILPYVDSLALDESQNTLFCKMIENMMPSYFLPIFVVDGAKNGTILQSIFKEFFKLYVTMNVDIETIQISKIWEKNVAVLFSLRDLYFFDRGFFEEKLDLFLPIDSHLISEEKLVLATDQFIDLIVYKILERTKEFLITDVKLYLFTLFSFFEHPFEVYQFFFNEMEFISNQFQEKYRARKLQLLDNFDNLAQKSLSVFKSEETHQALQALAKKAKDQN